MKVKVKLATEVKGYPRAPFSIATTPRCRGGCYSIPWIAPLHPWSLPYNAECSPRQHRVPLFKSLVWVDLGLNPSLLDHWQTFYSLGQWKLANSIDKKMPPLSSYIVGYSRTCLKHEKNGCFCGTMLFRTQTLMNTQTNRHSTFTRVVQKVLSLFSFLDL